MRALWVVLLLLFSVPTSVLAEPVIRILADTAVEGSTITLGEIAMFDSLAEDQLGRISSHSLGPAAPPAHHRTFSGSGLRQLIASLDSSLVIDVPEEVRVHTAYRDILPRYLQDRLEQALELRMPWPKHAVKLMDWRLPDAFPVPVSAQRLSIHFKKNEDFIGRITVRAEFFDADKPEARRTERALSVEAEVRMPVAVSQRLLRRGETLDSTTLKMEERDLRGLGRDVIIDIDQVMGARIDRRIAEGSPIRFSQLKEEPVVRRGDILVVQADGSGLNVRMEAKALETGSPGQLIQVENPTTRRRFQAQVLGAGSARLPLPQVGAGQ